MNRARMLFGGLFAALSLTAAPVFASPSLSAKAEARLELKGAKAPTPRAEKLLARVHYEEKLEARVLELVNQARARKGLPALSADARGTKSARLAAAEASREGGFGSLRAPVEERLGNRGVPANYEMVEITKILKGNHRNLDAAARKVVQGWLKSPATARLLLDADLTYAGVGAVSANGKISIALDAFGPQPEPQPRPLPRPLPQPAPGC